MDAVLFVLRARRNTKRLRLGCQWNALRETKLRSSSSAHRRVREWAEAGVFAAFRREGLLACDGLLGLDWSWTALDGAMGKAPLGGENRPQPHRPAAMQSIVGWASAGEALAAH